ncbi:MAG: DUF368 domain-containing protein, partial [Proteobacteria bacterium]|nr:DUF368 domain-containing protein [Pseudomonadota bacterium]
LMAGSMRKVWPFRQVLEGTEGDFDCVLPVAWDGEAILAFGLMVGAAVVVLVIERAAGHASTEA